MFESDDFDQVLSLFDFPELANPKPVKTSEETDVPHKVCTSEFLTNTALVATSRLLKNVSNSSCNTNNATSNKIDDIQLVSTKALSGNSNKREEGIVSPKHAKRKIINSHFDHKNKRKFPGPAGLLNGTLEKSKDETIGHMEVLSQDIEYTEDERRGLFESPLWMRLLDDLNCRDIRVIDPINMIKEQALAGNLPKRKAQTVTAFIETVDRSVPDPLITLRDATGNIECTLHRDAWSTFSPYLVSEYCALVLHKPTVLTTGGAFKKHYLNITLSNVYAIYSSAVLKDEIQLPEGFAMICEEGLTVIRTDNSLQSESKPMPSTVKDESNDLLDELESIFSDDVF